MVDTSTASGRSQPVGPQPHDRTGFSGPAQVTCAGMARRSLRPQLNQIRTWVRQGRTDAWIAHQLEATVQQVTAFKAENELAEGSDEVVAAPNGDSDLRGEYDALIAEQLEVEAKRRAEEQAKEQEEAEAKAKAEAERRALA